MYVLILGAIPLAGAFSPGLIEASAATATKKRTTSYPGHSAPASLKLLPASGVAALERSYPGHSAPASLKHDAERDALTWRGGAIRGIQPRPH